MDYSVYKGKMEMPKVQPHKGDDMRSRMVCLSGIGAVLLALLLSLNSMAQTKEAEKKPSITITSVPTDPPSEQMASDPIKGSVSGVNSKDYKVVIYAYGDKWYVQPTAASPRTDIKEEDNSWESETHGGTQFAALLVKPTYEPEATLSTLPKVGGDVVAITKKKPEKKAAK